MEDLDEDQDDQEKYTSPTIVAEIETNFWWSIIPEDEMQNRRFQILNNHTSPVLQLAINEEF